MVTVYREGNNVTDVRIGADGRSLNHKELVTLCSQLQKYVNKDLLFDSNGTRTAVGVQMLPDIYSNID